MKSEMGGRGLQIPVVVRILVVRLDHVVVTNWTANSARTRSMPRASNSSMAMVPVAS
jgi:hypothetical protein